MHHSSDLFGSRHSSPRSGPAILQAPMQLYAHLLAIITAFPKFFINLRRGKIIISKLMIMEGAKIPKGYGIAYAYPNTQQWACYPFPLNRVIHFFREAWFGIRHARFTKREEVELYKAEAHRWMIKYLESWKSGKDFSHS